MWGSVNLAIAPLLYSTDNSLREFSFWLSRSEDMDFLALNTIQGQSFMAFGLQLNSSSTSMRHGWVSASLVPRAGGGDNINRNGVSAGVWLSWNHQGLRLWNPCLNIHGSEEKNDITNSSSNFTAGPLQLSITWKSNLSISQERTLTSKIKPKQQHFNSINNDT